jgi:hypothetical protein
MMNTFRLAPSSWPRWLWISTLLIGAALLSPAYHCGFPLVAFVTIAGLTLGRQDALFTSVAVLLTHETLIFASQHHHATSSSMTWAAVFGVVAVMSCETTSFVWRRWNGLTGAVAAFVAAYAVYELSIIAFCAVTGRGVESFSLSVVTSIFMRNVYTFGGLWGLSVMLAAIRFDRLRPATALRHI